VRTGRYLVMRYGPLIGRAPDSRRRVSVVTRDTTPDAAWSYAQGWLSVERQHGDTSTLLWIAKVGAPATRRPRRRAA